MIFIAFQIIIFKMMMMTENKFHKMTCIALIIVSCVLGYFYAVSKRPDDGFFCTSDAIFHARNKTLNAVMNFHMQDGQGFLTLSGEYYENDLKTSTLSLQKEFNYSESNGEYILTQKDKGVLDVSEADKAILTEFIPDFYLTTSIPVHHIRIKELRRGMWIFTTTPVPYLTCTDY